MLPTINMAAPLRRGLRAGRVLRAGLRTHLVAPADGPLAAPAGVSPLPRAGPAALAAVRARRCTPCLRPLSFTRETNCTLISSRFLHTTCSAYRCTQAPMKERHQNPYKLVQDDMSNLCDDIKKELVTGIADLRDMTHYYFDGKGKSFRPMVVLLMARACNFHQHNTSEVSDSQRRIAMVAEMIHTASLVHDDVIDKANTRRGKPAVNFKWGEKKAILAGDFILSAASVALARLGNGDVVSLLSQVIDDLVNGEFMQLGSKENENERFAHYLKKNFKKTASLIAHSAKAVAVLGEVDTDVQEIAFMYGKHLGIAFQLIDDVLDFTACGNQLGKPAAADLKLGLATAPVLFACDKHPELHSMIMRRFSLTGDVEKAWEHVLESDGVQQTRDLAQRYCSEAVKLISTLRPSPERDALIGITEMVLTRDK
ncbi:all trans-polyprenyl-diphosphate synthase PDSS1 isoform X1 [Petromyzon marinus]|uniref:All trans-polyprenyl-diphosphate synthase PDSS1 n=1 Tax=Petromyzon marinus TaxID=7757 RepID=A0AAJ7SXF3_PETMA|nr:decaprenyl-diphosphate synthase subunit 1 isoform X1 [Petromyzon marinus]